MAKRLPERVLAEEAMVPPKELGREICRNCHGEIRVEPVDRRSLDLPHRRICRTCGTEYGTTPATLYPARRKYDLPKPGFQQHDTWL